MNFIPQIANLIHLILKEIWCKPGKRILWLSIRKVMQSRDNALLMLQTINYITGDSRKYCYPTTSLQIIFLYQQVICQAVLIWQKASLVRQNFFRHQKLKNTWHLRHSFFVFQCRPLAKMLVANLNGLGVKSPLSVKSILKHQKGNLYIKSGIIFTIENWQIYRMLVPLVCLDSLDHIIYVSCIFPRINTMSNENHRKIPRGQLVSIKSLSQ